MLIIAIHDSRSKGKWADIAPKKGEDAHAIERESKPSY